MRYFYCLFLLSPLTALPAVALPAAQQPVAPKNSLSSKVQKAKAGDFILSSYSKIYSLLFIREIRGSELFLEEITFPSDGVDPKKMNWQVFLDNQAKGNTSWTIYHIDLNTAALLGCYSETKKGWIALEDSEQFLTKLLFMNFDKVPYSDRRKIGPEPAFGESDTRAVWNPPLTILGKKITKPEFEVWRGTWPKDGSELAGCRIELFFNAQTPNFAFPHWIEVRSTHYTFKQHIVDSGTDLRSPVVLPIKPSRKA